jgi:hypothetical protein
MGIIQAIFVFLRAFIIGRAAAAAEILALRQQLAVCRQSIKRPKLRPRGEPRRRGRGAAASGV